MRALVVMLLLTTGAVAEPRLYLIPPAGSTFAPGQRFDVRIEANDIKGKPRSYSISLNGKDLTKDIFGEMEFQTYPLLDGEGRPTSVLGGGITRRNWSIRDPGSYELAATLIDAEGTMVSTKVQLEVIRIVREPRQAKNIILFIGDGMGVAQRTAARLLSKGVTDGRFRGRLEMDSLEANGFVTTLSRDSIVTDSSPSAAAYATGNKGDNAGHGVFADNTGPGEGRDSLLSITAATAASVSGMAPSFLDNPRIENITELLRRTRRMAIGIVTTYSVTDSTPGAFLTHTYSRYLNPELAEQVLASAPDVLLGAGTRYFVPANNALLRNIPAMRADSRNVLDEFRNNGYAFVSTAQELLAVGRPRKLLGLFHPLQMASRFDRMYAKNGNPNSLAALGQFRDQPDLEVMTERALDVLSQGRNGFFLMVEAANIDRSLHRLDPTRAVYDTIELDRAVGVARRWAAARNDTLIIVTADHETSGLVLPGISQNGAVTTRFEAQAVEPPNYEDVNGDSFPDNPLPARSLYFDFGSFNKGMINPVGAPPRDLRDLDPDATTEPVVTTGEHTATDVFIAASGPGSRLFGSVMENTEVFFKMLQAIGYR